MSPSSPITESPATSPSLRPPSHLPLRPNLLQPPATIISPPSPTDVKSSHPSSFSTPPRPQSAQNSDSDVEYESPDSGLPSSTPPFSPEARPRAASNHLGPIPLVASQYTSTPVLLHPDSPAASPRPRSPVSTRSPSPSSPQYRPRRLANRRESSTHRVRETMDGEQRNTQDGERMVNQYKIGKALGRGAYAKVELGVDVGTGTEYAVKEFSKSRLHLRALQEKHRQETRIRAKGGGESPNLPEYDGKRKAGEEGKGAGGDDGPSKDGPWGAAGTDTIEKDPLGLIRREIAVMKKLDHPNIVHLFEAISLPDADALFLVLEYLPGGVLMQVQLGNPSKDVKPPFSSEQSREYFRQLCLGLEYLHANEIIHRDIKPDNILLSADREVVKLCDFGVSEMFVGQGDDRMKKSGGSPAFLSPESFTAHTHEVHGKALDIWALGVTLYCMLTGRLPFNVNNPIDLFEVVRRQEPSIPSEWHPHLSDLVLLMLCKDPTKRIAMAGIREHLWVTEEGEEPMIETDDNLYHVGKHVGEPTQEELGKAIGLHRSVFTVIRAVQKMRRLQIHRRSISRTETNSTEPSLTSGSMDSYATHPTSNATSEHDETQKWKDLTGSAVLSPGEMAAEDSPGTERQTSDPFDKLKPIDTVTGQDGGNEKDEREETVVFDSPISEEAQATPVTSGPAK